MVINKDGLLIKATTTEESVNLFIEQDYQHGNLQTEIKFSGVGADYLAEKFLRKVFGMSAFRMNGN